MEEKRKLLIEFARTTPFEDDIDYCLQIFKAELPLETESSVCYAWKLPVKCKPGLCLVKLGITSKSMKSRIFRQESNKFMNCSDPARRKAYAAEACPLFCSKLAKVNDLPGAILAALKTEKARDLLYIGVGISTQEENELRQMAGVSVSKRSQQEWQDLFEIAGDATGYNECVFMKNQTFLKIRNIFEGLPENQIMPLPKLQRLFKECEIEKDKTQCQIMLDDEWVALVN